MSSPGAAARKQPALKSWRQDRVSPWTYVLLAVLLVPFLFPLAWMLLSSLKTQVENTAYPPIWVFRPTMANYREVFIKNPFFTFAWNSLVVAAGSTGLALLLGLPGVDAVEVVQHAKQRIEARHAMRQHDGVLRLRVRIRAGRLRPEGKNGDGQNKGPDGVSHTGSWWEGGRPGD